MIAEISDYEMKVLKVLREIARRGNDAEIRTAKDGSYKVLEVKKKIVVG